MQSAVSTSLVSKTGIISLTTFEKKTQSLVLEQVLESIFWTYRMTQTRPLGRAAVNIVVILFIYFFKRLLYYCY